ncbi:alpha/beta-hydrolase [Cutaneotrichosporon oleaginosum]|uniref:Alpha/beta-hydrolase n=2 Tax=Cutaneotrichosporon oleaginosum TaxID=879819 RepID=A0A0J1BE93_9TREE|nr:alpha/beta-hydrolase [Cutaneotrichosporon oleaginosum]KLT46404.1 alpha/beta-hydrolase [Cutaneotrichosporon oleaginosum]
MAERPGFLLTPIPKKEKDHINKGQLVIHCHGGGYTRGHPLWTPLSAKLTRDTRTPILSVQYRKCVTEATAYPAPLLDALSAYHYATHELWYAARDIVLVGDSAGGNLVLAVMQMLSKTGQQLPRGVALSSPWCDLTFSHPSIWHNSYVDYLALNAGKAVVASVARHYTPSAIRGPLLSPALAPAGTWKRLAGERVKKEVGTRVFVQVGSGEGMYDEAIALADTMRGDGVRVEIDVEEGGLHCGALTGFLGEDAYTKFAEGTERLLRGGGLRRESMNIGEVADKALSLL